MKYCGLWFEVLMLQLSKRVAEESSSKSSSSSNGGSMFVPKSLPKSMKMKLKGGGFVDPDSNLEHKVRTYSKISLFNLAHLEYPYRPRIESAWHQLNSLTARISIINPWKPINSIITGTCVEGQRCPLLSSLGLCQYPRREKFILQITSAWTWQKTKMVAVSKLGKSLSYF